MGQKYGVFDEEGKPRGFYDDEIHDNIPEEAIPLTDEQWKFLVENQFYGRWDFEKNDVYLLNNGKPSFEEYRQQVLQALYNKTRSLLLPTDYIVIKAYEAMLRNDTQEVEDIKTDYAQQLEQRAAIRAWHNEIEYRILNASTSEELDELLQQILTYTGK